jgi:hypothetical protein
MGVKFFYFPDSVIGFLQMIDSFLKVITETEVLLLFAVVLYLPTYNNSGFMTMYSTTQLTAIPILIAREW